MIKLQIYKEEFAEEWDNFVEKTARNSTFLHTRKFFRHNPINQKSDSSLIFLKNSNILCVVPAVLQETDGYKIWNSHAYSTYGGFVVSNKLGVEDAVEIVDLTIQFAKENSVNKLIVRNPFRIFNQKITDETDYAMWFRGFTVWRRDIEIAVPLIGITRQTIEDLYDTSTNRAIRKAKNAGVQIKLTKDFSEYWQVLLRNLAERHETKPTHTLEQFQVLESLVGDEKIKLFGAYLDEKLIAGIIVFIANKQAIHAQYIAGLSEFQHLRPINLLIHQISIWAIKNNFHYFNLGMCTNPDQSGINAGLARFKEGFGGRGVLRETMQLILT